MSTPPRTPGARSIEDGEHRRGGWWKWLLPLLLLLLVLIFALQSCGDDEEGPSSSGTVPAQSTPTVQSDDIEPGTSGGDGTLTANGQSLLGAPGGDLSALVGQSATGQGLKVLSVVKDEGFFVGVSENDRVYVEYGGDVGEDETSGFTPVVGDKVNLTGPVRPAPEEPAQTLNLKMPADVELVKSQGAYVNADSVERAQ